MELTDKVTVITGGATGIGAASAILYARAGAKVVIGDINVEGGEQTVATIQSEAFHLEVFIQIYPMVGNRRWQPFNLKGVSPNLSEPMST